MGYASLFLVEFPVTTNSFKLYVEHCPARTGYYVWTTINSTLL